MIKEGFYRHYKTGTIYQVSEITYNADHVGTAASPWVTYFNPENPKIKWRRKLSNFLSLVCGRITDEGTYEKLEEPLVRYQYIGAPSKSLETIENWARGSEK